MKKKTRIILILSAVFLCLFLPGFRSSLHVASYTVIGENISTPVRIALVTDLHSCAYGSGQRALLDAIDQQAPDLVLLGGDFFDDRLPDDNAIAFLEGIRGKYPCYYVTGNHEYWSGAEAFAKKMEILREYGVIRLSGETDSLEIGGTRLNVCGVDDPCAWADGTDGCREQAARAAALAQNGGFTVLLAHRPELLDVYNRFGFDLVLAGHTHGGQWRIPGLFNGLYAPDQGLFPPYAGGRYEKDGVVMIVSRGLARESTRIPRFYNRPELVVVDLTGEADAQACPGA